MPTEQVLKTSVSLFPQDEWIIDQISKVTGIRDRTGCIRYALNQWARHNLVAEPQPQPAGNGQTALVDPPAPYRAPVLREEVGVPRPGRGVTRED